MSEQPMIVTDTACICVYDLANLAHRVSDVGDWWSISRAALEEANLGNLLIFNVGDDGAYEVDVAQGAFEGPAYSLLVTSGRVFIGPGEEITGGEFEPDGSWGGFFIDMPVGPVSVTVKRCEGRVSFRFLQSEHASNSLSGPIRI